MPDTKINIRSSGQGMPVVLLHAFPLSSALYDDVRAPPGCRLLLPDFPGFGGTAPAPMGLTFSELTLRLLRALDFLGIREPVLLGGVSMGGYWAMEFLRLHPERVKGLLLASTRPGADDETARSRRMEIAARVEREDTDFLVSLMTPNLLGSTSLKENPHLVEKVQAAIRTAPASAVAAAQRAIAARLDQTPTIQSLDKPILWLYGEEDRFIDRSEAARNGSLNPKIVLEILPRVGHLIPWEAPEEFQAKLNSFAAEIETQEKP